MAGNQTMNINDILSDEEIEECISGSSDIKLIREIINMTQHENLVDSEDFADQFSYAIRGFIDTEDDEEYDQAFQNNWNWGIEIAENINSVLVSKWVD